MSEHNNKAKSRAGLAFLLGLTAVALYLCYVLIVPFLKPILFSAVLAILFYPLHSHILRWIRSRNASALLCTCLVILFIALSTLFLGRSLATGLRDIYQSLGASKAVAQATSATLIQSSQC